MNEQFGIQWIAAITKHIAAWVAEKVEASWEIVRIVSLQEGFFKSKLGRQAFADIVYTFCREALPANATANKITQNMEKSKWTQKGRFSMSPRSLRTVTSDFSLTLATCID